jgi:hypothetical protein
VKWNVGATEGGKAPSWKLEVNDSPFHNGLMDPPSETGSTTVLGQVARHTTMQATRRVGTIACDMVGAEAVEVKPNEVDRHLALMLG